MESSIANPQVTIVVSPRERFNYTCQSLESIYNHTEYGFQLVYVDGGSPENIKSYLQQAAREKGFELIRTDHYLSPNQARNIGLAKVKTKYVVFIENNVEVTPGWLKKLVECAEETNATVVNPLTCQGTPLHEIVHFAGGETGFRLETIGGNVRRRMIEKVYNQGQRVVEVRDRLKREEIGLLEFHCLLVRTSIFEKIGQFDEAMLSTREHVDFYLTLTAEKGTVYLEPDSLVTFLGGEIEDVLNKRKIDASTDSLASCVPVPPLEFSSVAFYMLRWSDAWQIASLKHFCSKWDLTEDEYFTSKYKRLGWRRQKTIIEPLLTRLPFGKSNSLGKRVMRKIFVAIDIVINKYLTNHYDRNKPKHQPAKVVTSQREYATTTTSSQS